MINRASLLPLFLILTVTIVSGQDKSSNKLSKSEKAAGWRLLFDGTTLSGWRGFHSDQYAGNNGPIPGGWMVSDGALHKAAGRGTAEHP
ncbi:MAG: hypothetical protein ACKOB4_05455, partial [Acidobacteriota bacterium]